MRILQETIVAIQEAVEVEDVLGAFLSLEKRGKKFLCPFHQEKDPSFSIRGDGKFYKCFSCQAKGGAVSFLMDHEGMSYLEAMAYLAKRYDIPWHVKEGSSEEVAKEKEKEALYILLEKVKDYYVRQLRGINSQVGYRYLEGRELVDPKVLDAFGLGYSLPDWHGLYEFAKEEGYEASLLEKAGLILSKEGKSIPYDRFRGRLIFPIHHVSGKVIGFAGREMEGRRDSPKYINSPETLVYQKGLLLYGLYQGKRAIKAVKDCYLVEGYTDVLALHQAGIENVVASGGTALTEGQIALLKRFTSHITLLFDGDAAGQEAAMRGIDLLLAKGFDVKVVCLPVKEDPDSFRRKEGKERLKAYLKEGVEDFIAFKGDRLFKEAGVDPFKKTKAMHTLLETIAVIPDAIKRAFYLQLCEQRFALNKALLEAKVEGIIQKKQVAYKKGLFRAQKDSPKKGESRSSKMERILLYMLLHYGDYFVEPEKCLADYFFEELAGIVFSNDMHQTLWGVFQAEWVASGPFKTEDFLSLQSSEFVEVARNLMKPYDDGDILFKCMAPMFSTILPDVKANFKERVDRDMKRLKLAHITEAMERSYQKLIEAPEGEGLNTLLIEEYKHLKKEQSTLAKTFKMVILPA